MTDTADWYRINEAYLAVALGWLRLRLRRCASGAALALRAPVPPSEPVSDGEIAGAAAAMAAAVAADPPPALHLLVRRFGLSDFERDLLLLCIGMELDPSLAALCAAAHGKPSASYPTFALALAAFDNPSWQPLLPDRPLRHFSLIEIHQPAATPLTTSALRADERVVGYAKGDTYVDDRLAPLLLPLEPPDLAAPPSGSLGAVVDRIVAELKRTPAGGQLPAVQLLGVDAGSKELVAARVAAALGLHLFRLSTQLLPTDPAELERLTRLWQRECALIPIGLYLDAAGDSPASEASGAARFLGRSSGLVLMDTAAAVPVHGRPGLVVEVERPTATEQAGLWRSALGADAGDAPGRLAGQFDFGAPTIGSIAAAARAVPGDRPLAERAWTLCLAGTRIGLDALAQRIEPKATWDDIVLPEPDLSLLRMIADQVGLRGEVYDAGGFSARTSRGLGINALFAGPSGTGKTMAAEVIANHLRLNLYRIDLSAVVSKYIGETEKNLERLFLQAENGGVILLFDEADALFGKRTEIRDSHDRYANIEVSYLLQRMESYRGLSILATNARNSLDTAFVRRLRFVVTFAYPRPAERKRIWRLVFPPGTRTENLDYDRLAQLDFAGGSIFGVALNAAFLAARDGTPVTMRHVLKSARVETRKLERPVNEREYDVTERMVRA